MPRGDRTGSWSAEPMTGRAARYCAGYIVHGYMNPLGGYRRGWERGHGRGFGRGWGRGCFVYPQPIAVRPVYQSTYRPITNPQTPEEEIVALENYQKSLEAEKSDMEQEMGVVKARIEELKAKVEK